METIVHLNAIISYACNSMLGWDIQAFNVNYLIKRVEIYNIIVTGILNGIIIRVFVSISYLQFISWLLYSASLMNILYLMDFMYSRNLQWILNTHIPQTWNDSLFNCSAQITLWNIAHTLITSWKLISYEKKWMGKHLNISNPIQWNYWNRWRKLFKDDPNTIF